MSSTQEIMSIFIPRVFANFSDERVAELFERLDMGTVSYIDRIAKTDRDGKNYHSIYVHFESWNYDNTAVTSLHEKLDAGESVRIVYDDPWYWTVLKNTTHKKTEEEEAADRELGEIQSEMEAEPSFDLVDTEYVSKIEAELGRLRTEVRCLRDERYQQSIMAGHDYVAENLALAKEVKNLKYEKKHHNEHILSVQQEIRKMMEERDYYSDKARRVMADNDDMEEETQEYSKILKYTTSLNEKLQAEVTNLLARIAIYEQQEEGEELEA
jgi:hypothetical protein